MTTGVAWLLLWIAAMSLNPTAPLETTRWFRLPPANNNCCGSNHRDNLGTTTAPQIRADAQVEADTQLPMLVSLQTERTGFEPAEGFDPFTDLANRRIRPLCHLSRDGNETAADLVGFAGHSF
jgi:hypothetical protein